MLDLTGAVNGQPERFVPEAMQGQLVEAEHLGRYWWVRSLAAGRRVLDAGCGVAYGSQILHDAAASEVVGVDRSPEIVDAARSRVSASIRLECADLRDLPLPGGRFDLIVCFEVIEHVEDPEPVLRELKRVLAPGGVLAVSTPNPEVVMPGNPHHHHEMTPAELRAALAPHFAHVRLTHQHNWLTSAILDADAFAAAGGTPVDAELRKMWAGRPGDEVYTIALAGDERVPWVRPVAVMTHAADVRGLLEHIQGQERRLAEQATRIRALESRPQSGLGDPGPSSRGRLMELEAELARAQAQLASVVGSRTWRYMAPIRAAAGHARRRLRSRPGT
jgi:2-polyprenyl-3-methyl-5-hydroxy-6-metoxy-1,4-benzoquinol methylase